MNLPNILAKLPLRFQWTLHNLIAHPLSEILFQIGFGEAGDRVHDQTVPAGPGLSKGLHG
jgi:hypothetical protein